MGGLFIYIYFNCGVVLVSCIFCCFNVVSIGAFLHGRWACDYVNDPGILTSP